MTGITSRPEQPGLQTSVAGSVILDIGADIGALVLIAPARMNGAEIEISRHGDPPAARTHSRVRERSPAGQASFAAVYPGLAAGEYTIWRDARTAAGAVPIRGGEVTTWIWPDDDGPDPAPGG